MEVMLALVIVVAATAGILNLGRFAEKSSCSMNGAEYINTQLKYQARVFGVAMLVLIAIYFVHEAHFSAFLALGNVAAPAKGVSWLGISDGESWLGLGASLSFFITLAFVYLRFRKSGGGLQQLVPFLPWVLLFSLTNSFSEEVVYRLGIIVPLVGAVETMYILLISAAAFGAPHLRGMPNGLVGALMAGLLGWLLAKSVVETNGIFLFSPPSLWQQLTNRSTGLVALTRHSPVSSCVRPLVDETLSMNAIEQLSTRYDSR